MQTIDELREQIDSVDREIVELLKKRMDIAKQIGKLKMQSSTSVHQKTREVAVLDRIKLLANSLGLSEDFVIDLYTLIFAESRRLQKKLMEETK